MKISFILKEHHLFDSAKFLVSKNWELKNYKIKEFIIQFLIFSFFTIYSYFYLQNIYITVWISIFFIVFIFLFLKFIDFSYEKKIRKFIENYRKEELWKENFIEILDWYFINYDIDRNTEYKIKINKLELSENEKYFFLYSKVWNVYFIPKDEISIETIEEIKKIIKNSK